MKRIWVLGSNGRLGAAMMRKWAGKCDLRGLSRQDCDLSDEAQLRKALEGGGFDWLINCTGMTNVDACETEQALAKQVNAASPGVIADICTHVLARLIHFSTDYVFDGEKTAPYTEDDAANPLGVYGATKLEGEQHVLAASDQHIVARVSWLFGADKPSFVDAIIQRALTEDHVQAVEDKTSCPTYSDDVADWFWKVMENESEGGLYHACNSGGCSWREYGEYAIRCAANVGAPVKTQDVEGIQLSSLKNFVATRPPHTLMANQKLAAAIGAPLRDWKFAVEEFVHRKFS
ncbi:MAG: dTDP-4-dehydrorhamnose reductase [Chthoniobacterales bacterium]